MNTTKYMEELKRNNLVLIGSCENVNQPLELICSCGRRFRKTLKVMRKSNNYLCNNCIDENKYTEIRMKSYKKLTNYCKNNNIMLLTSFEEYEGLNSKVKVVCSNGHESFRNAYSILKNKECRKCSNTLNSSRRKNFEEVKDIFERENYKLLESEYRNNKIKMKVICDKGHEVYISLDAFNRGCRCGVCNMSKGERLISLYLDENNINYIYDYEYFNDLFSKKGYKLRPDFILPDYKVWIEFDGDFHYRKVYETDYHEQILINDYIKNNYAKTHNWRLIRIPYWEINNINEILEKELI